MDKRCAEHPKQMERLVQYKLCIYYCADGKGVAVAGSGNGTVKLVLVMVPVLVLVLMLVLKH